MHPDVKNAYMRFTEQFEGGAKINYMFCDSLGRVGSAFGLDFDINSGGKSLDVARARREGLPKALALTWLVRATGRTATPAEVGAEWDRIKAIGNPGAQYAAGWYYRSTTLQMTRQSMESRVLRILAINEQTLKGNPAFRDFDQWPADAQLALLGLSWNGAGHLVGNSHGTLANPAAFRAACGSQDFATAAALCTMVAAGTNPSIRRRSAAQKDLFLNAATIVKEESEGYYKRPTLYWPEILV